MSKTPFEQFISLVQLDQSINDLTALNQQLNKEIETLKSHIQKEQALLAQKKDLAKQAQKNVDELELTMKVLDEKEKEKKYRLENITSHKEYQSIKNEIDQIKHEQHALEESLISAWNKLEIEKKEYAESQKHVEDQIALTQQKLEEVDQKIKENEHQIEHNLPERNQIEKAVPEDWLSKYNLMKARVKDPVVPVINGNCNACFYKVSAPDFQLLQRRRLLQCKDCFRLLYLPEAMQASIQSQEASE